MTKSTKQRTNGDDGMADEQIIELAGTKVDTLWTTVESGKLEDGTKYKKKQRLAPRTFEKAIQDDDGVLLSTKLETIQQQIDSVGGNVIGDVANLETENKETIVGAINEVNANSDTTLERLINSGILSNALDQTSINDAFTFDDLIHKKEITFFTNWSDPTNFPELYGSGIFLPGYDTRCNSIIYTTSPTPHQKENRHVYIGYVFTAVEGGDNQGLTTGVEWKRLMTNDEVSNPNLVINPDFSIEQRDGYIIKTGCTVYNEPALTTDVSGLGLSNRPRQVTYRTNTYAAFLGDNGYTYYVKINDIENGYVGANIYTVDRWKFNNYDSNLLTIHDSYVTLTSINTNTYKQILQKVDNWQDYVGETLTLSVKLRVPQNTRAYIQMNCGSKNAATEVTDTNGEWKIVTAKLSIDENANRLYVGVGIYEYSSGSVDIKWAKLELGSVATKFIPPQKSSELMKCKYYYQEITTNQSLDVYRADLLAVNIGAVDMRVIPTAQFKNGKFNTTDSVYIINGNIIDGFNFTLSVDSRTNVVTIFANKQTHGLEFFNTLLVVAKGNPVCLDAEIY